MLMKKLTLTSLYTLIAFSAAPAFAQIYDWKFETSEPTDINWSDIEWTKTENTKEPRDRFYLNINNSPPFHFSKHKLYAIIFMIISTALLGKCFFVFIYVYTLNNISIAKSLQSNRHKSHLAI